MKEMNDSGSKRFACSDELIWWPMFAKLHPSVPKKEFVVPLLPNKSPSLKDPGFEKAHCTSCASRTCWKCCCREGGGGTAKSRANSVVPHDCLPFFSTHRPCTCYKDYKVRDAFWITYCTLAWISRRKCGSWSPYTFTSHDFFWFSLPFEDIFCWLQVSPNLYWFWM